MVPCPQMDRHAVGKPSFKNTATPISQYSPSLTGVGQCKYHNMPHMPLPVSNNQEQQDLSYSRAGFPDCLHVRKPDTVAVRHAERRLDRRIYEPFALPRPHREHFPFLSL
ncbi:hypothetical protein RvY_18998-2 [Ramazzottius varieornatus]|uniref:Uncharacterized protein n=1 Tax=Ramazzottius varieornatus TaxID=947166 RepID=A0A1D1WBE2_RAMVA|nr:hypothetical protein RvY_18998-2 [Ramazzottius varieornatus]